MFREKFSVEMFLSDFFMLRHMQCFEFFIKYCFYMVNWRGLLVLRIFAVLSGFLV